MTVLIHYRHYDCSVNRKVAWDDTWSCAVNGPCPACGIKEIEPVAWHAPSDSCVYCDPEYPPAESACH